MRAVVIGTRRSGLGSLAEWLRRCKLRVAVEPEGTALSKLAARRRLVLSADEPHAGTIKSLNRAIDAELGTIQYADTDVAVYPSLGWVLDRFLLRRGVKVIWLHRDPWSTIKSLVTAGVYDDPNDAASHWAEYTHTAFNALDDYEYPDRHMRLDLDNWCVDVAASACQFLGVEGPSNWRPDIVNRSPTSWVVMEDPIAIDRIITPMRDRFYPEATLASVAGEGKVKA